jgi:NAD-dependent dihydropyrimidine dehydrogenase PreA subunit
MAQARGKVEVNQDECKSCPAKGMGLSPELNHYGVHPAQQIADVCSGCGICYYICPEPGAITVYKRAAQKIEVRDAATV